MLPKRSADNITRSYFRHYGMGRTWEKFSSLPAKKPQKFETATGKENFQTNQWEKIVSNQILDTPLFTHVFLNNLKDMISVTI